MQDYNNTLIHGCVLPSASRQEDARDAPETREGSGDFLSVTHTSLSRHSSSSLRAPSPAPDPDPDPDPSAAPPSYQAATGARGSGVREARDPPRDPPTAPQGELPSYMEALAYPGVTARPAQPSVSHAAGVGVGEEAVMSSMAACDLHANRGEVALQFIAS
jgi:hypothetical protein